MVIGESRYFTLEAPSGVDISSYSARYELFRDNTLKKSGVLTNNSSKFDVQIQTNDLTVGNYEVRVFITDPVDGFIDILRDSFVLEK